MGWRLKLWVTSSRRCSSSESPGSAARSLCPGQLTDARISPVFPFITVIDAAKGSPPATSFDSRDAYARSEEHTSELQSPYVISYAVFCLKKKNIFNRIAFGHTTTQQQRDSPHNHH